MNRQLEDKFHVGFTLPVVFIDSWSQRKDHQGHETEQEHFANETSKLWDFAINSDDFEFKGIDDVLKENEEMRNEIAYLNDVISDNITDILGKKYQIIFFQRSFLSNYFEKYLLCIS